MISILELFKLSGSVVNYIKDVKDAPEERDKILLEICSTTGVLFHLKDLVERPPSGDEWATTKWLGSLDGPLAQFKSVLEDLAEKFTPTTRIKKAGKALSWPFKKGGVADTLQTIERLKSFFTLALLKDQVELSEAIKGDVRETKLELTVLHDRLLTQECRDIIKWLSPLNFWTKQEDFFDTRIDGTGEWLLEHTEFRGWLLGTHTLWCHGMPGAGKTVLASVIINFLNSKFKSNHTFGVAFLYCSYKEQTEQTPLNLIAHLLQQFLVRRSDVPDELRSLYNSHINKMSRPSLKECTKMLRREIDRFSKTFIIIDALDEYTERDGAKDTLLNELRQLHPNVGFLVTSRNMPPSSWDFKIKHLEVRATDEDVGRYLKYRFSESRQLVSFVEQSSNLEDEVVTTIVEKAKGMFILARLHMDSLAKKLNLKGVRNALANLSQEISDTYDEAMRRIESQDEDRVELAKRILSWITHSFRPLTVSEIQHALAVEPNDTEIDKEALTDEHNLISVCAGLVVVDQGSKIIRLVHYTTQDYLNKTRRDKFPAGHLNIAMTCVTYISFSAFSKGDCNNDKETETRLQEYPLLRYAAQHWGDHTREGPNSEMNNKILRFLTDDMKLSSSVQAEYGQEYGQEGYSQRFPRNFTGLHVAASFGLCGIVSLLLEKGAKLTAKTKGGGTALHQAAGNGHQTVVRMLLEKGANVDDKDSLEQTALSKAAQNGHEAVVRFLLKKGANINTKTKSGGTALSGAAKNGHKVVAGLLLEDKRVDVNAQDSDGWTALFWAAENGHEAVARLLVENGANINAQDSNRRTALYRAAENGHEAIACLLVENGANINALDNDGRTVLNRAAEKGHEAVAQLLVKKGANIDTRDNDGRTALHRAAGSGQDAVVRLLVKLGADVKVKDDTGGMALHRAARSGQAAVVRLLVVSRTDVEAKDASGMTALQWADQRGHKEAVQLLKSYLGLSNS